MSDARAQQAGAAGTGIATFAVPDIAIEDRPDGSRILRSRRVLAPYDTSVAAALRSRAEMHPTRALAAARQDDGSWRTLTFAQAREQADSLAQAFLDLGLGARRPLLILSGNGLEHLVATLGAFTAGVPVIPLSVAYSLVSADHARIRAIAELTTPGLVFADDAESFAPALDSLAALVPDALVARGARTGALALDGLLATRPTGAVEEAVGALGPDTVAKLLFTSGSTGVPKGVINTHRMLCANQAMLRQIWPFIEHEPPVLVDWLPWSHTFGGNHNLGLALFNGGTIHIDDGRPTPDAFGRTLSALREVSSTVYFNVPAGYALLAPALEADPALARHLFARLRFMFYAAAALPDELALRLRELARRHADHAVALTSSWGTTETAPAVTSAHFAQATPGCIGVPLPGATVKLAPVGDRLEIRVAGPNVTPGYFAHPELTAAAFDDEGFYRTADAVRMVDEDPDHGLSFDGRIAEDFKLATGTWVRVGALRTRLVGAAALLRDAVICGPDREYAAALVWLNHEEARRLLGADVDLDAPALRSHLAAVLASLNEGAGSASAIRRLLVLREPPSLDAGEITDKGYLNQRACLAHRAADAERLYAAQPDVAIIEPAARLSA